jgi:plasmid stabilization system protein ParE
VYSLEYLPEADNDIIEAETYLNQFSLTAADKLTDAIKSRGVLLADNPLMYEIYAERPYFRCMPLPYKYLCFYHVDEDTKAVIVHRIIRGMRDIPSILQS